MIGYTIRFSKSIKLGAALYTLLSFVPITVYAQQKPTIMADKPPIMVDFSKGAASIDKKVVDIIEKQNDEIEEGKVLREVCAKHGYNPTSTTASLYSVTQDGKCDYPKGTDEPAVLEKLCIGIGYKPGTSKRFEFIVIDGKCYFVPIFFPKEIN